MIKADYLIQNPQGFIHRFGGARGFVVHYGVQVCGDGGDELTGAHVVALGHAPKRSFVAAANWFVREQWDQGLNRTYADAVAGVAHCWATRVPSSDDLSDDGEEIEIQGGTAYAQSGNWIITMVRREGAFPVTLWCEDWDSFAHIGQQCPPRITPPTPIGNLS